MIRSRPMRKENLPLHTCVLLSIVNTREIVLLVLQQVSLSHMQKKLGLQKRHPIRRKSPLWTQTRNLRASSERQRRRLARRQEWPLCLQEAGAGRGRSQQAASPEHTPLHSPCWVRAGLAAVLTPNRVSQCCPHVCPTPHCTHAADGHPRLGTRGAALPLSPTVSAVTHVPALVTPVAKPRPR